LNAAFGWRRCLLLCLPAILVGAAIRVAFLTAIPEGFYGADSPSYFVAAERIWQEHRISFPARRRWLYPLLLVPSPALLVSPARSAPVLQHLLGLATLFGIGWITGCLTKLRNLWIPAVTLIAAILPQMVWDEHELISETVFLALFVLTAALAMPPGALKDRKRLFWFLLSAAAVASVKPHGRGIWLGCVVFAVLPAGNPFKWGGKCWGALGAAALIILTSGEKQQGDWLLLSSTLPLVKLEGSKWKEYRDSLRPIVLRARAEGDQYPWDQKGYKKPLSDPDPSKIGPVWAGLTTREKEFSKVCAGLAREAILDHPFAFANITATKIGIAFANCDILDPKLEPPAFWELQQTVNDDRWKNHPSELRLFYGMDQADYEKKVAERQTRHNPLYLPLKAAASRVAWMHEYKDAGKYRLAPGWLGVLALLGLLFCFTPARFAATSVLWLPAFLYLLTVFAIADRKAEYVQPVEWIGLVLAAIALDVVASGFHRWILTSRSEKS